MGARAPRAYAAAADATLAAERAERASPAAKAFFTRASRACTGRGRAGPAAKPARVFPRKTRTTPAAAQKAAAAHAQRQGDLSTLRGMRMSKFTAMHEACA